MCDNIDIQLVQNLVDALSEGRPRQSLLAMKADISQLSKQLDDLAHEIDNTTHESSGLGDAPSKDTSRNQQAIERRNSEMSSIIGRPTSATSSARGHGGVQEGRLAEKLTQAAFADLARSSTVLRRLIQQPFEWFFSRNERMAHLQPLLALQRSRHARHLDLTERLLLICSCTSLANEFREFEEWHGWVPTKQDALVTSILTEQAPDVQKLGKHSQAFVSTFSPTSNEQRRLDAGIRLGMKLNIVEAIGTALGLGRGLALVFGFQVARLSRLPFREFASLMASPTLLNRANGLDESMQRWWLQCRSTYAGVFGSAAICNKPPPDESRCGAPGSVETSAFDMPDASTWAESPGTANLPSESLLDGGSNHDFVSALLGSVPAAENALDTHGLMDGSFSQQMIGTGMSYL